MYHFMHICNLENICSFYRHNTCWMSLLIFSARFETSCLSCILILIFLSRYIYFPIFPLSRNTFLTKQIRISNKGSVMLISSSFHYINHIYGSQTKGIYESKKSNPILILLTKIYFSLLPIR